MMKSKIVYLKDVLKTNHPTKGEEAHALVRAIGGGGSITLDFTGIDNIGEEFARELFSVWPEKHPKAVLNVVRACETIEIMMGQIMKTT